jgi:FMNH2-dependent dimethyl sulfone monooxygenase
MATSSAKIQKLRRATDPLFSDRKLKLGTFCINLSGGCAITTMPGTLEVTWPNTVRLAQLADDMQFEALVPIGRWRVFGGVTDWPRPV